MAISAYAAMWFLPFALPICVWVAWSDMKVMKIPNKAVIALVVVFIAIGLIVIPISDLPWRLLQLVIVLVVGFALNMAGMIGAGDAKFAAAMAPFVPLGDLRLFLVLFSVVLVVTFIGHRAVRRVPAITKMAPDWVSWTSRKYPMGLSLGTGLAVYLALGAMHGI